MSENQEVKVTDLDTGEERFFFNHSFKSSMQHADAYIKRNKGKFPMRMHIKNNSPYGAQWRNYGNDIS